MKRFFYVILLLSFAFTLQDCSSGKKAYMQGNYYESVMKSVNRLRKSPNHKKSIETLQQAYPLAVKYYEDQAQNSIDSNAPFKWKTVVQSYTMINNMYVEINRSPGALKVIPNPVDYYARLEDAKNRAADESYIAGLRELDTGDREKAKQAYRYFIEADGFVPGYKDVKNKIEESLWAATLKVEMKPIPQVTRQYEISADFFENKLTEYVKNQNFNQFVRFFSSSELATIGLEHPDHIIEVAFDEFTVGQVHFKEQQIEMTNDSAVVAQIPASQLRTDTKDPVVSTVGQPERPVVKEPETTPPKDPAPEVVNEPEQKPTTTDTNSGTDTETSNPNTSEEQPASQGDSTEGGSGGNAQEDNSVSSGSNEQPGSNNQNNTGSQSETSDQGNDGDGTNQGDSGNDQDDDETNSTNTSESGGNDSNPGNNAGGGNSGETGNNGNNGNNGNPGNSGNSGNSGGNQSPKENPNTGGQGGGSSGKVVICHRPPGNKGNAQTLQVSYNALQAHLDHGDTMGACITKKGGNSGLSANMVARQTDESNESEVQKDSLVNVYGTVKATVFIYTKTLQSNGVVDFKIYDAKTGGLISNEKMPGEYIWVSQWANFNGDERALTEEQLQLTKLKEAQAPDSQALFVEFTQPIYDQLVNKIYTFYRNY